MSEPRFTIVTVGTTSKTPNELIAAAYPGDEVQDTTTQITFAPFADGIFAATRHAATAADHPLGLNTLTLQAKRGEVNGTRGTKFYAASDIKMTILEQGA